MSSRMAIEDTPICSVDVDLIPTTCRFIRTWIRSQFCLCASIKVNRTAFAIGTTGEEQFSLVAKASSQILIWVVRRLASGYVVGSSASLLLPSVWLYEGTDGYGFIQGLFRMMPLLFMPLTLTLLLQQRKQRQHVFLSSVVAATDLIVLGFTEIGLQHKKKVAVEFLVKSHHMPGLYSYSCVLAVKCNNSTFTATDIEHLKSDFEEYVLRHGNRLENIYGSCFPTISVADQDDVAYLEWESLPPNVSIDIVLHRYRKENLIMPKSRNSQMDRTPTQKALELALSELKEKNDGALLSARALKWTKMKQGANE